MNILRYFCWKFQKLPFSVMESIWSGGCLHKSREILSLEINRPKTIPPLSSPNGLRSPWPWLLTPGGGSVWSRQLRWRIPYSHPNNSWCQWCSTGTVGFVKTSWFFILKLWSLTETNWIICICIVYPPLKHYNQNVDYSISIMLYTDQSFSLFSKESP